MGKYRVPDEQERKIIEANGIDLDKAKVVVEHRSEDAIWLLNFETRCTITIHRGLRPW